MGVQITFELHHQLNIDHDVIVFCTLNVHSQAYLS
jgi:hypothetical protein